MGGEGGRNGNGRRIRRKNGARNTAYVGVRTKYSGVGGEGCSSSSINTHYRQPLRVPRRPSSISFTPDTISLPHFEPPLLLSSVRMLERPVSFSCTRLIAFPRATKNTDRPTREFRRIRVRSQVSGLLPFAANSLLLVSRPVFFVTRQREGERFYLFYSNRPGLGFGLDETLASVFEIVWIVSRVERVSEHWTRVNGRVRYRLYRRTVKRQGIVTSWDVAVSFNSLFVFVDGTSSIKFFLQEASLVGTEERKTVLPIAITI